MSHFVEVLGGRKKSYGYWLVKSLRVYVRILPTLAGFLGARGTEAI